MAWIRFQPIIRSKKVHPVSLTIPAASTPAVPMVLLDDETVSKLAWSKDTKLALFCGDEEHDGQILIAPNDDGTGRIRKPGAAHYKRWRLLLGRMPCFTRERWRGPVQFQVDRRLSTLTFFVPLAAQEHRLPPATAAAVARASGKR